MYIQKAYTAGQKIRKAILKHKGNLNIEAYKIKEVKLNKFNLISAYLELCLKYNVLNDNEFMIDLLAEETQSEDVALSIALGIMSEETEFIRFTDATKEYGLADGTLRKKLQRGGFLENEVEKRGRDWWVSKTAMERIYGNK